MTRRLLAAALSLAAVLAASSNAQINAPVQQGPPLAYDVVSVKVNNTGLGRWGIDVGDYSYSATNIQLKELLASAYGIKSDLIFGVPGYIDAARFDIMTPRSSPALPSPEKLTDRQRPPEC